MLVTQHWSASRPVRLDAYHVEFALTGLPFADDELHALRALHNDPEGYKSVPWGVIRPRFTIWKNDPFTLPTCYGTWELNHDPRDNSANIEVAAMCMGDATTTNFGTWPYTIAHAWMHAAIVARVCALKSLSPEASFDPSVDPDVLQNGPIYVVSTHGERAIQTYNPQGATDDAHARSLGYFVGSGDPDSRWDCALLDPEYIPNGVNAENCKASAAWLRTQAQLIKAAGIVDYWGLDK